MSSPLSMNSTIAKFRTKLSSISQGDVCKVLAFLGLTLFMIYVFIFSPPNYQPSDLLTTLKQKFPIINTSPLSTSLSLTDPPTNASHIMFSIVGSMNTWKYKRYYSESWWRPNVTRGHVFLDRSPSAEFLPWSDSSAPFRVNEDIRGFAVYPRIKWPDQVRIFRTVMESFREGDKDTRWFVMTDDDTIIFVDNLVKTLGKYDHKKHWYIGMNSECVKSNFDFSFDMAFGGAGYALSYPLAALVAKRLDGCIERYPHLRVSDQMLFFCLSDLGFTITHEIGFHQIDLRGDASGYLSYHPQTPLLSLHHIDLINPIYPNMDRPAAIRHLMKAGAVDQSRLLQQTICYHRPLNWTFSMSWGYSAHIYEAIMSRNYLKRPLETFAPFERTHAPVFMFNTRWGVLDNPCEAPHVLFFESIERDGEDRIVTTYLRKWARNLPSCASSGNHSAESISKIRVFSSAKIPLEAGGAECCDVRMLDANVTEVNYRPCYSGEVMA
ncbi:uncharacterized protein LOC101213989 [Cucumis sativus]|uniref:Uncharacterized protein n=1 Tax=Cucumis sativus TaxID=3659 RepID=A0A0A0M2U4_CUCSA|nr:uncharacterized protein LOC101213989 [Cucumis sativus]KGN66496.1 hypothetical protein Csa_007491 [Cucumis sativus]